MDSAAVNEFSDRLALLERRHRRVCAFFVVALFCGFAAALTLAWMPAAGAQARKVDDVLTVRGLIVVDDKGVERVRLGSPLPDPIIGGKRLPRRGVVSGILIFDADGDERGGYVVSDTNGDAFLTLDSKHTQQALFIANRDGGANLAVWSGENRNKNYVSIQAVPTPAIEIVHDGKTVVAIGPPVK